MKTKKARIISPNWKIQQKKKKRSTEIGVDCVSFSNRLISHFQLFQISFLTFPTIIIASQSLNSEPTYHVYTTLIRAGDENLCTSHVLTIRSNYTARL